MLAFRLDRVSLDHGVVKGCMDLVARLLPTSLPPKKSTSDHTILLEDLHLEGFLVFAKRYT